MDVRRGLFVESIWRMNFCEPTNPLSGMPKKDKITPSLYTICEDGGDEYPIFIQTNEETHMLDSLAPDDHPLSTNPAFEPPVTETLDEKLLLLYQFTQSNKTLAHDLPK